MREQREFYVFSSVEDWKRTVVMTLFSFKRFPSKAQREFAETFLRLPPAGM